MLCYRKVQPNGEGKELFAFKDFRFEQVKAWIVL